MEVSYEEENRVCMSDRNAGRRIVDDIHAGDESRDVYKRQSYYDTEEHDWITEQEMGSSIMRETDNLWIPVKRFLNKHKKTKWGEWDGLHIEEEEL